MLEFGRLMENPAGELIMFCQISGISYLGEGIDYVKLYE